MACGTTYSLASCFPAIPYLHALLQPWKHLHLSRSRAHKSKPGFQGCWQRRLSTSLHLGPVSRHQNQILWYHHSTQRYSNIQTHNEGRGFFLEPGSHGYPIVAQWFHVPLGSASWWVSNLHDPWSWEDHWALRDEFLWFHSASINFITKILNDRCTLG